MNIVIDWGAASRRASVKATRTAGASFLLKGSASTPQLGFVDPKLVATWATASTTPIALTPSNTNPTAVTGSIAAAAALVRLDFDLQVTAGGNTKSALAFKQLFSVDAAGALSATQYAFADKTLKSSGSGASYVPGQSLSGLNIRTGTHPLVTAGVGSIEVNCEFVDLTELWWAVRKDSWGWYEHPKLGGRIENLYVLGWTGGGAPMLWFVAVPDATSNNLTSPTAAANGATPSRSANIVFFRPQPDANAFLYSADEKGFVDARHDDTTMHILARYLMSPLPAAVLTPLDGTAGLFKVMLLADQIALTSASQHTPPYPMPMITQLWEAFRPVGLETAVNRTGQPHVLFLPLGFDGTQSLPQGGYDAALKRGLRDMLASAMGTLIACNAVGRKETTFVDVSNREIWLAGHSAGNGGTWACLQSNAADIDRVISFDATPSKSNFEVGMQVVRNAAATRKKAKKTLELFCITTPNMTGSVTRDWKTNTVKPLGLDQARLDLMIKTGAVVTVLPPFKERESFWQLAPASAMTPFLRNLLANWTDAEIELSALQVDNWTRIPGQLKTWFFLFFHEMAVFGGRLVQPPPSTTPPISPTPPMTPAAPAAPPVLITLFESALGAPDAASLVP